MVAIGGSGRRSSAVLFVAHALALALVLIAAAPTSHGLRISESSRTEQIDQAFDGVTATCPRGEAPLSGGYQIPNPLLEDNYYLPMGTFPAGDDGWQTSAKLAAGDIGENVLTSVAYCSALGKDVKTRSDSVDLSGSTFTDLTAVCKRSEVAISGGWALSTNNGYGLLLKSLRAGKRSWTINGGMTGGSGTLLVFANCLPEKETPKIVTRKRTADIVTGEALDASASCNKREEAISAGYSSKAAIVPYELRRDGKRKWTNIGAPFSESGGRRR